MNTHALRAALAAHFDQPLTPEIAAAILGAALSEPDAEHDPGKFGETVHGGYAIRAELLRHCLPELLPLHAAHWLETEKHRHGLALDPDYDAMLADERAGRLIQFTARKDGAIAAHLRLYLRQSRHSQTLFAEEDTLYVVPEHRGGFLVMHLMRFAEQAVRAVGAQEVRANSKLVNRADVLMKRMGYAPVAIQFVKVFGGQDV